MTIFTGINPSSFLYQTSISLGSRELNNVITNMSKATTTSGPTYNPLSSYQHILLDNDKQTDDNSVFFYEYRGLLNSRLSTLITKLTNALTSDLDKVLGEMQDKVTTKVDPGAARTTKAYFGLWGNASTDGNENAGLGVNADVSLNGQLVSMGTTSLQMQQPFTILSKDNFISSLFVNLRVSLEPGDPTDIPPALVRDINDGTYNPIDSMANTGYTSWLIPATAGAPNSVVSYTAQALDVSTKEKDKRKIYSKFQAVLADALSRSQNKDILRWNLLKDVVIAATSTSATGSQVFASLSLNERRDVSDNNGYGYVDVTHDRWSAFYHS